MKLYPDSIRALAAVLLPSRRERCPCGWRGTDLVAHQRTFHIPAELYAWEAMGL